MSERFVSIHSDNNDLSAIIHDAQGSNAKKNSYTGVLIIVGGPQYRVGSHRQFVKLSRALAAEGIASMRFDSRGMGDSSGTPAAFYQQNVDINAAIASFIQHCPKLTNVVLWGLCDAASAILIKLNQPDSRISGVILLNPWVRQQQSHAKTMLKHYYLKRLVSRQFWNKLFGGSLAVSSSLRTLWQTVRASNTASKNSPAQQSITELNYVGAMLTGWQCFNGKSLVITSGSDLTAQEFLNLCQQQQAWQQCLNSAEHQHLAKANHTFAREEWRRQVEEESVSFILKLADNTNSDEAGR